jgi:SOS-response transcriptional repressor LexA
MIPYGLLSQISLIVIAGALTITYIKPTFATISDVQDKISTYQEEKTKVAEVNQTLATLVKEVDSVSLDDHKRLLTYMPDEVDTIAVPRDIEAIATEAGVLIRAIDYEGALKAATTGDGLTEQNAAEPHSFIIQFESSYEQLKKILSSFEQNHYPLEVREMEVRKMEGGFLDTTVKLTTYDRTPPPTEAQPALQ